MSEHEAHNHLDRLYKALCCETGEGAVQRILDLRRAEHELEAVTRERDLAQAESIRLREALANLRIAANAAAFGAANGPVIRDCMDRILDTLMHGIEGADAATSSPSGKPLSVQPFADREAKPGLGLRFRKRPVVVEAVQWNGCNLAEIQAWGCPAILLPASSSSLIIGTLEDGPNCEAMHVATLQDWIIRGVKGEFYPCKPDVFDATYEQPESRPGFPPTEGPCAEGLTKQGGTACECPNRKALQGLVRRLDETHADPIYRSVWQLFFIHGGDYTNGPKYEGELNAARAALAAPCPCEGMRAKYDSLTARLWPGKALWEPTDEDPQQDFFEAVVDSMFIERDSLRAELANAKAYAEFEESQIVKLCEIVGAEDIELAADKVERMRDQIAASQERERALREKLERVYRIASGEDQVAEDDTDGMAVIAAGVRALLVATPEGNK